MPGCGCPAYGADAHHVTAWSAGGGTALTNLVLLCPRHHQHVHAGILDVKIHDGRRRHRIDPIDLRPWWNRPTSTDPPHDDRHFGAA